MAQKRCRLRTVMRAVAASCVSLEQLTPVEQDGAAVEIVIAQGEVVVDGLFGNVEGCQYQSTGKTYIIFAELSLRMTG